MNLREELLKSKKILGVWGCGYIGFSSMANFALNGVRCVAVDVDANKVNQVNKGDMPIPNMEYWLGFSTKQFIDKGLMRATTNWKELINKDVGVHLICIPTEKGAKPYDDILKDVLGKLVQLKNINSNMPPLIIIESTLTPGRTEQIIIPIIKDAGFIIGKNIMVGIAPRRDWFISADKSLKTLPRIIGGTTDETTMIMKEVLSIVCDNLLSAKDHKHAELVKSVENAFRHIDITFANQLSLAYPDIDIREVLRLVGTKWNIGTYQPSFGTGGYCIPLASQYVMLGTKYKDVLTILDAVIKTDSSMPKLVAQTLVEHKSKKVGILGLSYKGDLKVHVLSPAIAIVECLKDANIKVKLHDPYYSSKEIQQILGIESFEYPQGLNEFDAILIVSDHREYKSTPRNIVLSNLSNCKLILNNTDIWKEIDFKSHGIDYRIAGTKGWLC